MCNVYIRVLYRENTIEYVSSGVATDWRQMRVSPQKMRLKSTKLYILVILQAADILHAPKYWLLIPDILL